MDHFGEEEATKIWDSLEKESTHALIINPSKVDKEAFLRAFPNVMPHPFIGDAFYYDKGEYDFGKSILHASGGIYIQDASAMMPAHLLGVKEGDEVIDLCAAPGGKSIDAVLFGSPSILVSNDISTSRARELSGNMERMGIPNAIVTNADPKDLLRFYGDRFDKVILDAPCSGSAMFRKNDLAKSDWSEAKVNRCAEIQRSLIRIAFGLLKPGGEMVYSTCSFSKQENEELVLDFLQCEGEAELIDLPNEPSFFRPGLCKQSVYLLPSRFEGEGQFICKLRKTGDSPNQAIPKNHAKTEKACKISTDLRAFLEKHTLSERFCLNHGKAIYSLPVAFPFPKEKTIRPGLKLCEDEPIFVPDFALSHALDASSSISLSLKEAKAYLRGETFSVKHEDGFFPVSYLGANLGFVKVVKGVAKNHYPKGLRKDYSKIDY